MGASTVVAVNVSEWLQWGREPSSEPGIKRIICTTSREAAGRAAGAAQSPQPLATSVCSARPRDRRRGRRRRRFVDLGLASPSGLRATVVRPSRCLTRYSLRAIRVSNCYNCRTETGWTRAGIPEPRRTNVFR